MIDYIKMYESMSASHETKSLRFPLYFNFKLLSIARDLCKKALLPTTETPTQFFGCFRPNHSRFYPNAPLNPPRIPHNQASGPPFRRQQAHLAC